MDRTLKERQQHFHFLATNGQVSVAVLTMQRFLVPVSREASQEQNENTGTLILWLR